jgi:rhamnulokinase
MATMVAVDLGAQSGRVVLGRFDGALLSIEEVHRFENVPVLAAGTLYWDALRLYGELLDGLSTAAATEQVDSVGVDSWGVDFALVDLAGTLIGNPVHHRDRRTEGAMGRVFVRVPARELYERTGIQLMPINTLFQLVAMAEAGDRALEVAHRLLFMPDLFHFWLSGVASCELTNATTSQCYDPRAQAWATDMLARLGLPAEVFRETVHPSSVLGPLRHEVAEQTRLRRAVVVAPATHDTASAVVATPLLDPNSVYISAGSWSLVGMELAEPLITDATFAANLTNEGGLGGTVRLLRNVDGLWLLHECRNAWRAEGHAWDFAELVRMAEASPPLISFVEPNDPRFLAPGDVPDRIQAFCAETGQAVPQDAGAVIRCVLESLALKHRQTVRLLAEATGVTPTQLHIVGGGALNPLLCQWTADAAELPVLAGPVEATAIGNVAAQAIALGELSSLDEARAVIRASFEPTVYEPSGSPAWREAGERFDDISTAAPAAQEVGA